MPHPRARRTALASALALSCIGHAVAPAGAQPAPGLTVEAIPVAHHDTPIVAAIWYPAEPDRPVETVYANPVFAGVLARPGAAPQEGAHPLVVLSHGFGGTHRALAWLASGLAARGAVVVAIDHPGGSVGDFDLARAMRAWTRAQDVSAVIDAVLADPPAGVALASDRIGIVGFSFGGHTALMLAGLRGDLDAYRAFCEADRGKGGHCDRLARAHFDLASLDAALWNGDFRDDRIARVAAIDPGPQYPRTSYHLTEIAVPLLLVTLGAGDDRLRDADVSSAGSGLAPLLVGAGKDVALLPIEPARHFTAMPVCREAGPEILASEDDDPVCDDPPGTDRAAVHARIVAALAAFFGL